MHLCECARVLRGYGGPWPKSQEGWPPGPNGRDPDQLGPCSDFQSLSPRLLRCKAGDILLQPAGQVLKDVVDVTHPAPCSQSTCAPFPQDRPRILIRQTLIYPHPHSPQRPHPSSVKIEDGEWLPQPDQRTRKARKQDGVISVNTHFCFTKSSVMSFLRSPRNGCLILRTRKRVHE